MITSFKDKASEDIFNGIASRQAQKACPRNLWNIAVRKLDQLDSVIQLNELKIHPGNRFEALKGKRKGEYSIRINQQFRICFKWNQKGPFDVEVTDYH